MVSFDDWTHSNMAWTAIMLRVAHDWILDPPEYWHGTLEVNCTYIDSIVVPLLLTNIVWTTWMALCREV